MFNAIGYIKGQDDRANADFGNSQQIFPSQHIRIKPVVQPRVRISPALFDPLWRAEHLTESVQVGPDFWILGQDMSSTVFIAVEIEKWLVRRGWLYDLVPGSRGIKSGS